MTQRMVCLCLIWLAAACGQATKERSTPKAPPKPSPLGETYTLLSARDLVPVETFIERAARLAPRIRDRQFTLRLASNIAGARFACALGHEPTFRDCPEGDRYTFSQLVHGKTYTLRVRATTADGRVDLSPATVSFIADFEAGASVAELMADRNNGRLTDPLTAESLPRAEEPAGGSKPADRRLLLASSHYVVVPEGMVVTSLATDRTVTGDLGFFRLMRDERSGQTLTSDCTRPWEKTTKRSDGLVYCEGYPSRAEMATAYNPPLPADHVRLAGGPLDRPGETLFVAAFTSVPDQAERAMTATAVCQGASASGPGRLRLSQALGRSAGGFVEQSMWCQRRDSRGEWWWIAYYEGQLGGGDRLKIVYAMRADVGIASREAWLRRSETVIPALVLPRAYSQF